MAMVRPIMPVFEYLVNEDYIAEFLCVNKDKPEMHCNGKCYLAQMLKKQQEERGKNLPSINLKEYPIGFVDILQLHVLPYTAPKKSLPSMVIKSPRGYQGRIFHPPNFC